VKIRISSADMMPGGYCSVDVSGHKSRQFTTIVAETRRVRTEDERRAIVAEAMEGHRKASAVARKHGIAPSLLFRWKRLYAGQGESADPRPSPAFMPVTVALPPPRSSGAATKPVDTIEIETAGGRKLRFSADIDIGALKRILAALEMV
jgi:transposase